MKALLVVDMQNVFVGKNHAAYFKYDEAQLMREVNRIIDENRQNVVVYIRNLTKKNLLNKLAPFQAYVGTKEAELAEALSVISEHIFDKYVGDAFTNPALVAFLKSLPIDEIEIVGVDGGGCVALTAFGAIKNGYQVTLLQRGIGTMFPAKKERYFKKLKAQGAAVTE